MNRTASTTPPARRAVGLALIRDSDRRVLLLDKIHDQDRFGLPGGPALAGEAGPVACQRHVHRETGLKLVPRGLLVVHHTLADGEAAEDLHFVFDCGELRTGDGLSLPPFEIRGHRWAALDDLPGLVAPHIEWRITLALQAGAGGPVRYLVGHPPQLRAAA
jgi:ADP-ribose pyrophosphatase YjhB (NUDIX family)